MPYEVIVIFERLLPSVIFPRNISPECRKILSPGESDVALSLVIDCQAVLGDVPELLSLPVAER